MFRKITILFLLLALFFTLDAGVVTAKSKLIRVAILRNTDHFVLAVGDRYTLIDQNTGKNITTAIRLKPSMVTRDANGRLLIGDQPFENSRIIVEPRRDASIRINDIHFRGVLVIINNGTDGITVVNAIDLEQYIRGVLYHEISDKWPMEAIKAQAVATRTYALYSMETFAARDYDVTNDVYSQVYGGKTAERYRTNLAVKRTKGQVLTYRNKIIPAFFHANSGGITESAAELWDINIPPLKGGVESPYSVNSPHYRWQRNFQLKDIQEKINAKGHVLGLIKTIRIKEFNPSQRVRKIEFVDRDGQSLVLTGKEFREILGPNALKSNMYNVQMKGYYVDFIGHGWGHGVGLDQWGAYNMARMNFTYDKILSFYYPGTDMTRYEDID